MRRYRTLQGDTWDMIAYRCYGTEKMTSELIQANSEYADYVVFPAGLVLNIPEEIIPATINTPPWRR